MLVPCGTPVGAQTQPLKVNPETGESQEQFAARTAWWREAKFGMFIHWGVYAVPADSSQGAGEWYFYNHTDKDPTTGAEKHLQVADYAKFADRFNPVRFDARKWVSAAKNAGMKYIVITTKHHDGFCMFDSKLTDYNIVKATPFHRDPLKELARECRRQGIRLCFYHSIMDWHEADYLPRRAWDTRPVEGASLNRYIQYMEGQLRELLTHYGPIGVIWFDGGWEHSPQDLHADEVVKEIRALQPGILINNRIDLPEDFDTPEQTIPANALPGGRLWETCMTLNDTWGYARNDHDWKSGPDLIRKLCDIASKGGNFLLNVGPTDLGEFTPETLDRLTQVGAWMKANGESIYGTTKSPFKKLAFKGRCTQKGNRLYLQVFEWPESGLQIRGLTTPIVSARTLNGGETLPVGGQMPQARQDPAYTIGKPSQIDPVATVIELRLAGPPHVTALVDPIHQAADGSLELVAADAQILGNTAQVEQKGDQPNIGYWTDQSDRVAWTVSVQKPGSYRVVVEYACPDDVSGSTYKVALTRFKPEGSQSEARLDSVVVGTVGATGDWATYHTETLSGTLVLNDPGLHTILVIPQSKPHLAVMNLRRITLKPE
jgi:alpha-L-fucosidase